MKKMFPVMVVLFALIMSTTAASAQTFELVPVSTISPKGNVVEILNNPKATAFDYSKDSTLITFLEKNKISVTTGILVLLQNSSEPADIYKVELVDEEIGFGKVETERVDPNLSIVIAKKE